MRRAVLAVLLALLIVPAHAHARTYADGLAARLERDPVLVARGAQPTIPPAEARRLRRAIRANDAGRVQLAILPAATVRRAGGARRLANALDKRLGPHHGAVIVVAGRQIYSVTTHAGANGVTAILRAAVDTRPTLAAQLGYAIPFIARIDPGPVGDLNAPGPKVTTPTTPDFNFPDISHTVKETGHAVRDVGLAVGGLVVAALVLSALYRTARDFVPRRRALPPPTMAAPPAAPPPSSPVPVGPDGGRSAANEALGRPDG